MCEREREVCERGVCVCVCVCEREREVCVMCRIRRSALVTLSLLCALGCYGVCERGVCVREVCVRGVCVREVCVCV